VTPVKADNRIRDLEGREVREMQPGHIYLVGGKKMMVR